MIYLHVTLEVAPGKFREFNELMSNGLVPLMEKHGAKLIGSWETAVGTRDEVTDLWCFDNMGHFEGSLESLIRDSELRSLLPTVSSVITKETTKLLRPLPFSPLK